MKSGHAIRREEPWNEKYTYQRYDAGGTNPDRVGGTESMWRSLRFL